MLQRIGVSSLDELYSDVPSDFIFKGEYDLPDAMSEQEVRAFFEGLAAKTPRKTVFVGAGAYDHYTPAVIPQITSRSEFLTAYTPYQCEISQGTLRYIFEYQSMICKLTGMDVSNASMYDGPSAAAEAVRFCLASTRKKSKVLLSSTLLPNVIRTVQCYAKWAGTVIELIPSKDGQTSLEALQAALADASVGGVIVPGVNRYGIVEDHEGFAEAVHKAGALLVEYCDPSTLAVVKSPAEWGADLAFGHGQPLGIPLCYGGPYVGFMACKSEYMRKLPGRIVGQTTDAQGRRCFVLTLQAREQHIRREKATSNICSNQSMIALWCTAYLSLMGPKGLRRVNELCYGLSHRLYEGLLASGKFEKVYDGEFIKEFVLKPLCDVPALQKALQDAGYFAALQTEEGYVTFCVTERRSAAEVDEVISIVRAL